MTKGAASAGTASYTDGVSGEAADHEPVDLANLAELLHNGGLSSKDQQAVRTAVVDSMIEGATRDRDFVQRLVELAAGESPSTNTKAKYSRQLTPTPAPTTRSPRRPGRGGSASYPTSSYQTTSTTHFQTRKTLRRKVIRPPSPHPATPHSYVTVTIK